jgi:hypothetical protein
VVETPLRNLDLGAILTVRDGLFALTKQDGVFRAIDDPAGDDGRWWTEGAEGLPDVELTSLAAFEERAFVIGKQLLYEATAGDDGRLHTEAFGTNPGKAALDGNGELVFAGETELTAVAIDGDRVFAGTKDGLFVTRDRGLTWDLYNGPAEVKGLTIVDGVLHALVVSRMVPDPIGQPTVEVKAAALWSHRLADDVVVEPEPPTGCGCSTRSGAPAGGILVGVAVLFSMFRRGDKKKKPGKTSLLAWSRKIHTWTGVALALVIFVEGCTGLFLTHKDDLKGFAHTELPFGGGAREAKLTRAALELDDPAHLVVATRDRVAHSRDAGASWSPVGATSGFDKIEALSVAAGAIWVGHGEGLARCALDGVACAAIDLGVTGRAEVRAIAVHDGRLFVAIHRHGVRVSDDGGTSWSDATASLWSDPRSLDEKGERHVHGIAFEGASLWVATSAGLFRASDGGWARAGLPERYVEDVALTGRAVWATTKHPPALLVSSDRGISWRSIEALPDGKLVPAGERVLVPAKRGLFEVTATGAPSRVSIPGLDDNGPVGLGAAGDRLIAVRGARAAVATSGTWQATTAVAIEGRGKAMTVGKFLEDLHTGELFGKQLWIVYDLGALAMILFVFTGLHMWIAPVLVRRRKRAKHAPKAGALDVAEPT